ncbi:hypothetical protein SNE40_020627 [Patella caerulea]|uniref:Anoctamin n=1 Tax=Patella caerulea TaxID=87958 RepID=A0AAN8J4S8_PATCE
MSDPESRPIGFEMMEQGMAVSPQPPPPPEEIIYPPVGQNMDTSPLVSGNTQPIGFEDQVNPAHRDEVPSQRAKGHVSFSGISSGDEGNTNGQPKTKIAKDGTEVPAVETLYFRDGVRRIDFVLAYNDTDADKKVNRRTMFENNLKKEGVELEYEERHKDKLKFVKIHCPWEVLISYAEVMSMKMPLAMNDLEDETTNCWSKCPTPFDLDEEYLPPVPDYFTAAFSRNRLDKFIVENKETFFSSAQRGLIAYQVLSRCTYEEASDKRKRKFGIKNLINSGVYQAAYPLHEGEYLSSHSLLTRGKSNDRHLLYETWAKPSRWYKYQPLDHIRTYFGEKIGIYFAWLGYYTALLLPAALIGLAVFIYGCVRLFDDTVGKEICDENGVGNFTMCPLCDVRCTYWKLKKSCTYSRATYIFDNEATVFFAGFMALWATFFHEMWKRKQAEIEYDWDVADFEQEENIRPEYEAQVSTTKKNPINQIEEPHVRFAQRICRFASSFITVVFMLCLVVAAAFGVIVYRVTVAAIFYSVDQEEISARANLITTITAAIINLIIIVILSWVYLQIATFLTNFEMPRTETEWEDSFTFKMFLFQFINHYSSIFYIAFFKGRFIGRPGAYNRQINFTRQEECDPAGCLIELCIQLGIVMVGKQSFNNFKEIILPKVMNWFKSRNVRKEEKQTLPRWEDDYNLAQMNKLGLFDEYLEMVIQFGFVTIFVSAFPLAPLFALLNNVIEVRLDAYKFVTQWRRPLAVRGQDIGIWFGILRGISTIAVMSNACIIGFTTEFIPKLVYVYGYSSNQTLTGYVDFSLSTFNVSQFEPESLPANNKSDVFGVVTNCRYRDFRSSELNKYNLQFWHVLTARLAFVIAFILLVFFLSWLIAYMVPDIPKGVKLQVLREKYLAKEAIMESESVRRRKERANSQPDEGSVNY